MPEDMYEIGENTFLFDLQGGLTIEDEDNYCYFSLEEVLQLLAILKSREMQLHSIRSQYLQIPRPELPVQENR